MSKKKKKTGVKRGVSSRSEQLPVFKPNYWMPAVCAVLGFVLYANTLGHGYVLDDVGAITGNEFVKKGISGIKDIFSVGMWHFDNVNLGYYRPLSMATFAIEYHFFPDEPMVNHLGNVVLYAATGFVLCLFLMNMFRNFHPVFSFAITLLFITHPIHTEVVANIKSRDEILAFFNMILATYLLLLSYKDYKTNNRILIASCVIFYLALLSKESAMTGLLLAPLAVFFTSKKTIKESLLKAIPFLVMILIFQFHKYQVLGTLSGEIPKDIVNYPYTDSENKFPSVFMIFLLGLKKIILPHPLSYDYSFNQVPAVTFASMEFLSGLVIACALAYYSFKGLLKRSVLAFGILMFCATLAPAMAFVFLRGGIFAERFLYAPTLGFSIALVWFIGTKLQKSHFKIPSLRQVYVPAGVLLTLLSLYSFKTVTRNPVWFDNMSLFSTDVNASPNSCQVRRHYGSELINEGIAKTDSAEKLEWFNKGAEQLRTALRINPHFGDAFFKLGVAYQTVNVNTDSAIYYYTQAIREAPGYAISYNNMGILYEGKGKHELASYYYNKATDVNPRFSEGVRNRDNHRNKTGLDVRIFPTSTNLDSLEQSTPEEARNYQFYYKLGTDYASKGDYANAARCLEKSTQLNPSFIDALVNLSNCYGMLKQYEKNIQVLQKVIQLSPNNVQAHGNLAVTYELMGNMEMAEEYRDKAEDLAR